MQDLFLKGKIYKHMNYEKIYNQLIEKRINTPINEKDEYCEKHHIIPVCLCGNSNDNNIVRLTAREHYIAHLLLAKIMEVKYGKDSDQYEKMISAITYFNTCKTNSKLANRKSINFNSRIYENVRRESAKISSKRMKGKLVGEKNPMYGKKRTLEERKKISETRLKRGCGKGSKNPMFGKPLTSILSPERIALWHKRQSDALKSEKNPCYGRKWMHLAGSTKKEDRIYIKSTECEKYLKLGYIFGMKEKRNNRV